MGERQLATTAVDRGREAIQASAQQSIDADMSIDVTEDSPERIADGVMVSLGSWTLFDADGAEVMAGKHIMGNVLRDGACLIHRHFGSTVPSEEM